MSLIISVSKTDIDRIPDLNSNLLQFCETSTEQEEKIFYIPLGGRLLTVISLLRTNGIDYELRKRRQTQ